jgi:hypothetical protein
MRNDREKLADLDKTNDEELIVKLVKSCRKEADSNQGEWTKRAKRNIEYYVGNQWLTEEGEIDDSSPAWRFRTQVNLIFNTIQSITASGLDARPRVYYSADDQNQSQLAEHLTDIIEAYQEMRLEEWLVYQTILWFTLTGIAWRKYLWDANLNRPTSFVIPAWEVGVDPDGCLPDCSDHRYLIHTKEEDIDIVARRYGVDEDDIAGESADADDEVSFWRRWFKRHELSETVPRKKVAVHELWYFGQTPADLIADEKPAKSVKYPQGRVFVVSGNKLLYQAANPFNHARAPLLPFHGCTAPSGFLGFGIVDQLAPIQFALNVLMSQAIMSNILMANPQWVVEEGAVNDGWITNEPGLVIKTAEGMIDRVEKQPGVGPSSSTFRLISDLTQFAERVSSVSEVMWGRQPGGSASGIAIAGLQQAASTTIRQYMRWFEMSYKLAAIMEAENLQQYANPISQDMLTHMNLGEWFNWEEEIRQLRFDVHVQSLSELPRNLEGRLNFGMQMVQLGVFDIEEFLDFTRIPISDRLRSQIAPPDMGMMGNQLGTPRQQLAGLQGLAGLGQGVPVEGRL